MNLEKLNTIIDTVNVAGINRVILKKNDDGSVSVRGSDDKGEEPSIVIISETDKDVVDNTMAIHRVPVLLNRMNLFNLDKARVSEINTDEYTKSITIKENRKKVTYTFADPNTLMVPDGTIDDNIICSIVFKKEDIENIIKANQALSPELFTLSGVKDEIIMVLFDGISDSFTNIVGTNNSGDWEYSWKIDSVMRLIKHAIKKEDSVELGIGKVGILYITVNNLIFMAMPQVQVM